MEAKRRGFRTDLLPPGVGGRIARVAAGQHGVVSRTGLAELGLDRHAIGRRVAGGFLRPRGEGAALSHRAAADLWGLRPAMIRLEVSVPHGGRRVPGVRAHQTRMLDPKDFTVEHGIPVTGLARTLLDLAAVLSPNELAVALDRAERLRLLDLRAVEELLQRARGRRGANALRRAIARYTPSTQKSELEKRFRTLIETTPDIPSPSFNAMAQGEERAHEVDALWDPAQLAVQLDGFALQAEPSAASGAGLGRVAA